MQGACCRSSSILALSTHHKKLTQTWWELHADRTPRWRTPGLRGSEVWSLCTTIFKCREKSGHSAECIALPHQQVPRIRIQICAKIKSTHNSVHNFCIYLANRQTDRLDWQTNKQGNKNISSAPSSMAEVKMSLLFILLAMYSQRQKFNIFPDKLHFNKAFTHGCNATLAINEQLFGLFLFEL